MQELSLSKLKILLDFWQGEPVKGSLLKGPLSFLKSDSRLTLEVHQGRGSLFSLINKELFLGVAKAKWNIESKEGLKRKIKLLENYPTTRGVKQAVYDNGGHNTKVSDGGHVTSIVDLTIRVGGRNLPLPLPGGAFDLFRWSDLEIDPNVIIVYIENREVFRNINNFKYLWAENKNPKIYIERKDAADISLKNWLQKIPNKCIHFGDYDLGGIFIYLQFYNLIGNRTTMLIPKNIENLISKHGSIDLWNKQSKEDYLLNQKITDDRILPLYKMIRKYRKGYEQEGLAEYLNNV